MANLPENRAVLPPKPRPELRAVETTPASPPPSNNRDIQPAGTEAADGLDPAALEAAERRLARRRGGDAQEPNALPRRRNADPAGPKRPGPKPARPAETAPLASTGPAVAPATMRPRHWLAILSFVLLVLVPFAGTAAYLWTRAADQFHSEVAFSVRSEDAGAAAAGMLGAITQIGTGSASDADILFEYIRSQRIVEEIDADLDLRAIYNRPEGDPVFTLGPDATIEELLAQWRRMVDVAFDSASGIIHVRANAFTPADAQAIAEAILAQSSALVNRLSGQAREDAIRFAREELAEAEANLAAMRAELAGFRRKNRIVDPSADAVGQMGLMNALQSQLAQALVERDMLLSYADAGDQRVVQANRRIDAITGRIEEERTALGGGGEGGASPEGALPDVLNSYEELLVDLGFANTAYTQALGGLASARAEARRQSRYLAPHIQPTFAESALYPRRPLIAAMTGLFLLLTWGIVMLIYYNVRDNR